MSMPTFEELADLIPAQEPTSPSALAAEFAARMVKGSRNSGSFTARELGLWLDEFRMLAEIERRRIEDGRRNELGLLSARCIAELP